MVNIQSMTVWTESFGLGYLGPAMGFFEHGAENCSSFKREIFEDVDECRFLKKIFSGGTGYKL